MSALVPHVPPTPLRPLVSYQAPAYPAGVHRGLPSRHLTLVVELLAPLTVSGLEPAVSAHGVVGGLHNRAGAHRRLPPAGGPAVRAHPRRRPRAARRAGRGAARPRPRPRRPDRTYPPRLVEQLHAAASWAERFRLLDDALLHRLAATRSRPRIAPEVAEAWRVILASDGTAAIASVASHVGWGRRHLGKRFRQATGLTPKEAARVARFERAQQLLRARGLPLAQLAVESGYADQPHLAREWRSLTGDSITTWVREELPFVQDAERSQRAQSLV